MLVHGQLEYAQLHNLASAPTPTSLGLMYIDTGTGKPLWFNGTLWRTFAAEEDIASSATQPPVGSIVAYNPGYYGDGANGTFTRVGPASNNAAGVNAYLPANWRVCDGSALNDSGSPIFNGSGRFLPNLTDDRFLMGDTAAGTAGGSNSSAHTHSVTSNVAVAAHSITQPVYDVSQQPAFTVDSHTHNFAHHHQWGMWDNGDQELYTRFTGADSAVDISSSDSGLLRRLTEAYGTTGPLNYIAVGSDVGSSDRDLFTTGPISPPGGSGSSSVTGSASANSTTRTSDVTLNRSTNVALSNNHSVTNNAVTSGAASATENRPLYLQTFYIMRVK